MILKVTFEILKKLFGEVPEEPFAVVLSKHHSKITVPLTVDLTPICNIKAITVEIQESQTVIHITV